MTLPTVEDIHARSLDHAPFANGTEGFGWESAWCATCVHDVDGRDMTGPGCPILVVALSGRTPAEWLDGPVDEHSRYSIADQYRCVYYRPEDDGGDPEPAPLPEPPGMEALWPRSECTGVRMLTRHPEPAPVPAIAEE